MQEDAKQPVQAFPKTHHTLQLSPLFKHNPFPHKPRNVNLLHEAEKKARRPKSTTPLIAVLEEA